MFESMIKGFKTSWSFGTFSIHADQLDMGVICLLEDTYLSPSEMTGFNIAEHVFGRITNV